MTLRRVISPSSLRLWRSRSRSLWHQQRRLVSSGDDLRLTGMMVHFSERVMEGETWKRKNSWVTTNDPQMWRYYQMLYKATCWQDVQRCLESFDLEAEQLEMAWNVLKSVADSHLAPEALLQELVERTGRRVEELTERGFASVWHGMAKMNVVDPPLMQKMAERATRDAGSFIATFSPRHLSNVVYACAKIRRLARLKAQLKADGTMFPGEKLFVDQLFSEGFRRINELNEKDLSNLALSLSILEVPPGRRHFYEIMAQEVEKEIHLGRFSACDLVNVAVGLASGGGLDLFQNCPTFLQECLSAHRLPQYEPNQLALLLKSVLKTDNRQEKLTQIMPLIQRLVRAEVLPELRSMEFRTVIAALSCFTVQDPALWNILAQHLMHDGASLSRSAFDLTVVIYTMGVLRLFHGPLLDRLSHALMASPETLQKMGAMGLSNCFFGIGVLRYRNEDFTMKLCDAVAQEEKTQMLTPSQKSNIIFSLGQLTFWHTKVVQSIVRHASTQLQAFDNRPLLFYAFGLSLRPYPGLEGHWVQIFEEVFQSERLQQYQNEELSMAVCALGRTKAKVGHRWPAIVKEVEQNSRCRTYTLPDVIRIVKAYLELHHPVPLHFKQKLTQKKKKDNWIEELSNRNLLDLMLCLNLMKDPQSTADTLSSLRSDFSLDRLRLFRHGEISELVTSVATMSSQLEQPLHDWMEQILEKVIVHGNVQHLSSAALYAAASLLGFAKRSANHPVIYSLVTECSKLHRLERYTEQQLTSIFYNLSVLNALYRTAFEMFAKEIIRPQRLARYQEQHVVKVLKGLSIGKCKNTLIAHAVLNAFVHENAKMEPASVATILFNMFRLRCWKAPYVEPLLKNIRQSQDLSAFSMWAVAIVTYTLGREQHKDDAVIALVCKELTTERLRSASNQDLCNLVAGFANLQVDDPDALIPLLSEALRSSRCSSYSMTQLALILRCLSEWQVVDPSQLAGLLEPFCSDKFASIPVYQVLNISRALQKLRLFDGDVAWHLLHTTTRSDHHMHAINIYELKELRYLATAANLSSVSDRIQTFIDARFASEARGRLSESAGM